MINPEVINVSKTVVEGEEGCLSIPGWRGLVERPEWVHLKAHDIYGRKIKLKVDDLLAHIFMHEIDHLNGILYTQYIKDPDKLWLIPCDDEQQEKLLEVQWGYAQNDQLNRGV